MDERLLKYVKKNIKNKNLKQKLLEAGWAEEEINDAISIVKPPKPKKNKLGFFQKLKLILTKPSYFFDNVRDERKRDSLLYLLKLLLISDALLVIALSFFIGQFPALGFAISLMALPVLYVVSVILSFIGVVISSFISAAIYHLFVILFKGKKGYGETFNIIVYSGTPVLLLMWLSFILGPFAPLLSSVLSIWGVVLTVMGIHRIKGLSIGKSVLVILLPILLLFIFFLVASIFITYSIFMPLAAGDIDNIGLEEDILEETQLDVTNSQSYDGSYGSISYIINLPPSEKDEYDYGRGLYEIGYRFDDSYTSSFSFMFDEPSTIEEEMKDAGDFIGEGFDLITFKGQEAIRTKMELLGVSYLEMISIPNYCGKSIMLSCTVEENSKNLCQTIFDSIEFSCS